MNALGDLMGDTLGSNGGFGGLGLNGTGRGAGGDGRGTLGLDTIGNTLGRGTCRDGENCDYGRSTGHFHGREARVPRLRITGGETVTNGGLSKEVIRRVVRRHHNEVKFCYEQGLSQREDLEGRVTTRFLISPTGAVQTLDEQGDSPAVEQVLGPGGPGGEDEDRGHGEEDEGVEVVARGAGTRIEIWRRRFARRAISAKTPLTL